MLTKKQKEKIIEELIDKIKRQNILIFTDFKKLKVGEIRDLRKRLKEANAEYKAAKKTLIKLAFIRGKKDVDTSKFESSVAIAFGYDDPLSLVKTVSKFSKEHGNLKILGGLMEDRFLLAEEIKELAKIPSRNELLAKLLGTLKAPISGFVNVLQGNIRNLLSVLSAIKK